MTSANILPKNKSSTRSPVVEETAAISAIGRKCAKLVETTYRNNLASDYTEQIAALSQDFRYANNSDRLWSAPSHSLLYGTPLYENATEQQQLALNHLSWFANYNYISNSETETVMYNQVTGSVFEQTGYGTLAKELAFETEQEHDHIKAFRKVGLGTATALIGRSGLNALLRWNSYRLTLGKRKLPTAQYYALREIAHRAGKKSKQYSHHLHSLEQTNRFIMKAPTAGMLGRSIGPSLPLQSFYGFSWGTGSAFMACQFYTIRMIANLYLKNMEHAIAKFAKSLENKQQRVPAPTAISRYHFLDEAFHTTISRLLARDLYKEFSAPTLYERTVANSILLKMQKGTLGGLSTVLPHRYFADDFVIIELLYQLLKSPVFGFSEPDAKHWLEQCLCTEHDGVHTAAANRSRLLKELRDFFIDVDYLWAVNRDMGAMSQRGAVESALTQNQRTLKRFWEERDSQQKTGQQKANQQNSWGRRS